LEKAYEKRSKQIDESTQKFNEYTQKLEQKLVDTEKQFAAKLKETYEQLGSLAATNNQQREAFNELSNR
jgi:hypothetical protein